MNYMRKVLETLGRDIADKEFFIDCLQAANDKNEKRIKELEEENAGLRKILYPNKGKTVAHG